MLKRLLVVVLFLFAGCRLTNLDYVQEEVEEDGKIVHREYSRIKKSGLLHGKYTSFYDRLTKKEEGTYNRGKKKGKWKQWYKSGQLKSVTRYSKGLKQGFEVKYDEYGKKTFKASYSKDKLHGRVAEWYYNGNKKFKANFSKGIPVSTATVYYENGKKMLRIMFEKEKAKVGVIKWNKDGKRKYTKIKKAEAERMLMQAWKEEAVEELPDSTKEKKLI